MRRWLFAWGPAAAWAAFLFLLSDRSTLLVELDRGLDKVAHFGAYLVLGLLLAFATERLRLSPAVAIVVGLVYGLFDEIHQSFVPGRIASVGDWLADVLGASAGILLYLIVWRIRTGGGESTHGRTAENTST